MVSLPNDGHGSRAAASVGVTLAERGCDAACRTRRLDSTDMRARHVPFGVAALAMAIVYLACGSEGAGNGPVAFGDAGDVATADAPRFDAPPEDDDAGDACATALCPSLSPTKADLDLPDGGVGWVAPGPAQPGACTSQEIASLAAAIAAHPVRDFGDVVAALSPSCARCATSVESSIDTSGPWRYLVTTPNRGTGFANPGACYAVASGSDACGAAAQYMQFCVDISCYTCLACSTGGACTASAVVRKECATTFGAALESECDGDGGLPALRAECDDPIAALTLLCGVPGVADAGGD